MVDALLAPWLGSVLGLIGLMAALYFYSKSKRLARVAFQVDEFAIVGGQSAKFPHEMEIRFGGVPVNRVTATRVVFWNAGNETIGGEQIVATDPIRFELAEDSRILKYEILQSTRDANGVQISLSESGPRQSIEVTFQYLDPQDGFILEIFHSGSKREVSCQGTLRGVPKGILNLGRINPTFQLFEEKWRRKLVIVLPFVMTVIGILFVLAGLFQPLLDNWFPMASIAPIEPGTPESLRWGLVGMGTFYTIPALILIWMQRRRHPASLNLAAKRK